MKYLLGYTKNLFILPFDHRSSFLKMFSDINSIVSAKWIIYEAFKKAVSGGISKEESAILIDEQFGDKILLDAKREGFVTLLATEKSGQKEFIFEYGNDFAAHIEKYKPTFVKALIRYNPEDEKKSKSHQQQKLKLLTDYCHNNGYKFLLEVLIAAPNTSDGGRLIPTQSGEAMTPPRWTPSKQESYNEEMRPKLQVLTIKELQNAGVEPDVWKLEGSESEKDYQAMINQAQKDGRKNVGVVVLGRGENQSLVEEWIKVGARVKGILGFAVGRTVFWQPLLSLKDGKISKQEAIDQIANNFKYFYDVFMKERIKI